MIVRGSLQNQFHRRKAWTHYLRMLVFTTLSQKMPPWVSPSRQPQLLDPFPGPVHISGVEQHQKPGLGLHQFPKLVKRQTSLLFVLPPTTTNPQIL